MNLHETAMRSAFSDAVRNVPRAKRTRLYAMVCSALNRKLGLTRRKTMWSAGRGRR